MLDVIINVHNWHKLKQMYTNQINIDVKTQFLNKITRALINWVILFKLMIRTFTNVTT